MRQALGSDEMVWDDWATTAKVMKNLDRKVIGVTGWSNEEVQETIRMENKLGLLEGRRKKTNYEEI